MRKTEKTKSFLKILLVVAILLGINFSVFENIVIATDESGDENVVGENNTLTEENTNTNSIDENTNTNTNTNTSTTTPVVVEKKLIQKMKIVANTSIHSYLGTARQPDVNVYDGNKKLKVNKDYKVTYKNNTNPGKARIIITGIGDYTGQVVKYFYIAPQKEKITSVRFNSTATKATITWKKAYKCTGYKVFMAESRNGKYTWIKTIQNSNTLSFTKKGLDPRKEYYFKVTAYKEIDGKKIYKKLSEPRTQDKLLATVTLTASSSGSNRNHNLKLASEKISGLVLKPGETFNWFKVVGPASKARGYLEASVFQNGKTVKGYGGGVCQVSTTIYQTSLKVGLQIVERHQHSKPVTYTKLGKDATVSYGVQNLRIKNNKNYSIRIVTSAEKGSTTCKMYKVGD